MKYIICTLKKLSLSAILFLTMFSSCKKSDSDVASTKIYMVGNLSVTLPQYALKASSLELKVAGITTPTDSITYKWLTKGFSVDSVFGQTAVVNVPSAIGSYTITLVASHPRYVSKTSNFSIIVIDPSSSTSLNGLVYGPNSIIDTRDGTKYYYSKIGDLDWFTQNLSWAGAGNLYGQTAAFASFYGRLYTWKEATSNTTSSGFGRGPKGICPEGWTIPTNEDWQDLAKNLNNGTSISFDSSWPELGGKLTVKATLNDVVLWKYSPYNNQTNNFSWNALPGGNSESGHTVFRNMKEYGFWWSSTEKDQTNGYYRYIYYNSSNFPYNYTNKEAFGASVRCVRKAVIR